MGTGSSRSPRQVTVSPLPVPTEQTLTQDKEHLLSGRSNGSSSSSHEQAQRSSAFVRPSEATRNRSLLLDSPQRQATKLPRHNDQSDFPTSEDLQAELSRLKMTINRQSEEKAELQTRVAQLKGQLERQERESKSLVDELLKQRKACDEGNLAQGSAHQQHMDQIERLDKKIADLTEDLRTANTNAQEQQHYRSFLEGELARVRQEFDHCAAQLSSIKVRTEDMSDALRKKDINSFKRTVLKLAELSGAVLDDSLTPEIAYISLAEPHQSVTQTPSYRQLTAALAAAQTDLVKLQEENDALKNSFSHHAQGHHKESSEGQKGPQLPLGSLAASYNGYVGTVVYVGDVDFATGNWIGLELMQPLTGSSNLAPNGLVGGKTYFSCKPNHGILLRSEDVYCVSDEAKSQLARTKQMTFEQLGIIAKGVIRFQAAYRGHAARKMVCQQSKKDTSRLATASGHGFAAVDSHALKATDKDAATIKSLCSYLQKACSNQLEYARAAYRWICANISYDTEAYFSGKRSSSLAGDVLSSRKSVCAGYASLYAALCRSNSLDCEVVEGYSKGYSYRDGDSFRGKSGSHAWNAVCAEGIWRLVDCCWGAGYCDEHHRFHTRFNEHQFAGRPEYFILTHFPETEQWQLLDEPLTLGQFEKTASPKIQFFQLGLGLLSHTNAVIQAPSGEVQIKLSNSLGTLLLANVKMANSNSKKLDDYSLVQSRDGVSTVTVQFPSPGNFILSVFGRSPSEDGSKSQSKQYDFLLSYTVRCKVGKPGCSPRFPHIFSNFQQIPGSYIFSPLTGSLSRGKKAIPFHLALPTATKVAIVVGNIWTKLQRDKHDGEWRGEVVISQKSQAHDLQVLAQFPAKPDENFDPFHYTGILKYSLEKAQ